MSAISAQRRAGQVTIDVRTDRPGVVVGDAPMIERAVLNVLDNAVKWSPTGGCVLVDLTGTTITVIDNGDGIAPGEVPHVFEHFWRAQAARAMPGSGLGLSIVRPRRRRPPRRRHHRRQPRRRHARPHRDAGGR